jgi:drug/metabolite transporter (DMT)-like permease
MKIELKAWLLLFVLAGIWGSSFILMKKGLFHDEIHPIFSAMQVGALRITIASSVLLPFGLYNLRKIKTFKHFIFLTMVGVFGNFIPAFLFTYAETGLSSGYAGMLNSFTPIFTLLIGFFVFKVRLSSVQIIGVFIGFIGIVLLMLTGSDFKSSGTWLQIAAIVLATFMYGISLNTIKHTLQQFSAIEITSLAFSIVFIPSLIANYIFGTVSTLQTNPFALEGLTAISILAIFGTALANIVFNRVITYTSTLFASGVTYFIPIVAVLIGFSFGERITFFQLLAMVVVLIGVFIANYWRLILDKFAKNKK